MLGYLPYSWLSSKQKSSGQVCFEVFFQLPNIQVSRIRHVAKLVLAGRVIDKGSHLYPARRHLPRDTVNRGGSTLAAILRGE